MLHLLVLQMGGCFPGVPCAGTPPASGAMANMLLSGQKGHTELLPTVCAQSTVFLKHDTPTYTQGGSQS